MDAGEKAMLGKMMNIDNHSLTSALDPDEVPRFELENENVNLIWKSPAPFRLGDISSLNVCSIGFFYRGDKLIIISSSYIDFIEEKFIIRINTFNDLILSLINSTIKHFIDHLKAVKIMSREIQQKINSSMGNEYLLQMFNLSEILIYYLDALDSDRLVLGKFENWLKTSDPDVKINFLSDIVVELNQAVKQAEIYSQVFAGLMDARGTLVNNNMNTLIKNLTVISIIFLPLNLIASIGGMSEFSVMTSKIPKIMSYGFLAATMVLIGWLTLKIINKAGMVRRPNAVKKRKRKRR